MSDDLHYAVLHVLVGQFQSNGVGVEIGMTTQNTVDHELELIGKYREWLKSQTDRKLIKAYEVWLNHFERNCKEAQKAIDHNARDRWQKDSKARTKEFERIAKIAETLPRP